MATKAKATKQENYSAETTEKLLAAYAEGKTVEELAVTFSKTPRSIVAKLSREGVYKKAEYQTKGGEKPETKAELVAKIADAVGVTQDILTSLEASTKEALKVILKAVTTETKDMEIGVDLEADATEATQ